MPAHDTPLVAARRQRLTAWIESHFGGQQASFIAHVKNQAEQVNQGLLSALLKPHGKSFGEKQAQRLEAIYGMPAGYLVKALDAPTQSQPLQLDASTIRSAITLAKKSVGLVHGEELVIERDPALFAKALRTVIAQRQREAKRGTGPRSGVGRVGAAGGTASGSQAGEKAATSGGRKRRTA